MERCFGLQADAGVYGIIVCGSLGENMTLEPEETLGILNIARSAAGSKPVLMTVCESSTKRGAAAAKAAAKAGGSGFRGLPGGALQIRSGRDADACPDNCRSRRPADHGLQ